MSSIRNKDGIWINTEVFRDSAKHFLKYKRYCDFPVSSDKNSEYYKFWKEENRRCREGYEVGGAKITGDHYNYLNYSPITLTAKENEIEAVTKKNLGNRKSGRKIKTLPDFWDGDYDYFWSISIAEHGISLEDYKKLKLEVRIHQDDLGGGKHIAVGKARRKGFSFKNASKVVNTYKRIPKSLSIVAAYDYKYLTPKGTMAMVVDYISHINEHTAWNRKKLIKQSTHQKDGYQKDIGGVYVDAGFLSEVMAVSCMDNPDATRGKDPILVLLEEAGKFPNLKATLEATEAALEDGIYVTGLILIFGTGGKEANDWKDFEEIFTSPAAHNLMRFENIWSSGGSGLGTYCGFYFPDRKNLIGFIDKQGNSDQERAFEFEQSVQAKIKAESRDPSTLVARQTEHANSPEETFNNSAYNIFPVPELREHRNRIIANESWKMGVAGDLHTSDGELRFVPDSSLKPLLSYPHKDVGNLEGCIVQYYAPYKLHGSVPPGLYILVNDPFDQDQTTNFESIGSTFVMMNPNNVVPGMPGDMIVATYHGRPQSVDEYNERMFKLAQYYNAKVGAENDRGDIRGYTKRFPHLSPYLYQEFELGWSDLNNRLGRGFGMSMAGGKYDKKKKQGDTYIKDWLNEVRFIDNETGTEIKNLHTIRDLGFLDELIGYKAGGNYDRISAFRIAMYFMKELEYSGMGTITKQMYQDSKTDYFKTKLYA